MLRMYLHNFTVVWPYLFPNNVYFNRSCCDKIICNYLFAGWRHTGHVISDSSFRVSNSSWTYLAFPQRELRKTRDELHGKEIMHEKDIAAMTFIPRFAYCVALCTFSSAYLTFFFLLWQQSLLSTSEILALYNYCSNMIGEEILLYNTVKFEFLNSSTISHRLSQFIHKYLYLNAHIS